MINHFTGEEAFKHGLEAYLQKYKFSNADRENLWETLGSQPNFALPTNITLHEIMDGWVSQPGFPVVTAIANYDGNKIEISQVRAKMQQLY